MLTRFAHAKINLALDILYKRPDGYHEIDSVMQTIALSDQLTFELSPQLELTCNDRRLPTDDRNLAWKAAELLQRELGIKQGAKIHICKNIPMAAGLAGGSADAAEVLLALNELWGLGLSIDELVSLGVRLGADVPFCIRRGTARARGIGEQLTQIPSNMRYDLLLVTPNMPIVTALAYGRFYQKRDLIHPQVSQVVHAMETGDFLLLTQSWGNVFEELVRDDYPVVIKAKSLLNEYGLTANLMSGSGPSVFALNPPPEVIEPFFAAIPPEWFRCYTHFLI
ncbi:MAG TPA: 4-(cytidine 5'-diphospho)-2-C-methyl-D-erythritol kinase [Firmicutes bacterium]|jgi:4-diphosphocytidyl-2-C-methyl-D-erythritol kinase|nr:4-(cytidine 5'-diphospho)-2-C-methyl-D-erythritol kinase [Bacillota bacterium]